MKTLTITIENGTNVTFNETESKVLTALYNEAMACTGGEFGYAGDARKALGMNKNQFAGYMSQMQQKEVFEYLDTNYNTTYGGQFTLTSEVNEQMKIIKQYS